MQDLIQETQVTYPLMLEIHKQIPNTAAMVGSVALGDLDMSEDEDYLYVVNLKDKTIYKFYIGNPPTTPTATDYTSFLVPNPGCSNNDYIPWALKIYDGKTYVGVTCTALTSKDENDLMIYVLELDESTGNFTTRLSSDLLYNKGAPLTYAIFPPDTHEWQPWEDTVATIPIRNDGRLWRGHPMPLLSDLEIDETGALIIGMTDVLGLKGNS